MPSFTMLGVPHVLVTIVSSPRCHQMSYMSCCGPRSSSHRPRTSKVSGSRMNVPPGPLPSGAPSALRKMPSGPQWTVCGAAYPVRRATVSGSITFTICGRRGSGFVSRM